MIAFRFIPITPHPLLSPYVAKIWVFESAGRLPSQERKLIVPNTNLKLTLSYRNGISARVGNQAFLQRESELTLTGLIDTPVILDPHDDTQTGTIIIEFNPLGAYRLFHLSFAEVTNQIVGMTDLFGPTAEQLRTQLTDAGDVDTKLQILQNFLIRRLETTTQDTIFDYCIDRIYYTRGLISVTQLEKETGYTARWLQRKFSARLGTGPKNLAEIVRFKQFYLAYSNGEPPDELKQHIYHYYHDQSHFIRAFKRFTGTTPTELQKKHERAQHTELHQLSSRLYNTRCYNRSIFA